MGPKRHQRSNCPEMSRPEKAETAAPATGEFCGEGPCGICGGGTSVSSKEESKLKITVGEKTLFAVWEDNSSAEAFQSSFPRGR